MSEDAAPQKVALFLTPNMKTVLEIFRCSTVAKNLQFTTENSVPDAITDCVTSIKSKLPKDFHYNYSRSPLATYDETRLLIFLGAVQINRFGLASEVLLRLGCDKMSLLLKEAFNLTKWLSSNTLNIEYINPRFIRLSHEDALQEAMDEQINQLSFVGLK